MTDWWDFKTTRIGGVELVTAGRREIVNALQHDITVFERNDRESSPRLMFDLNGQGLSLFHTDPAFKSAMLTADVVHADGGFLVSLSKLLRIPKIKERTATTDIFTDIATYNFSRRVTFFLLGGTEDVSHRCAQAIKEKYPGVEVVGRRNGYFAEEDEANVVDEINRLTPDVLWVGMGKPLEQFFAAKHAKSLKAGWLITCGGCYNFVTGDYKRAPRWMQYFNMEWVYRLISDPRRLFFRYLITTPHALYLSLKRAE